ncbi:mannose-1-phosphate guanylyltransferase/mannose-6-phosphate isomerase [Microvirga pudoricolor]|uniref:mannose-1-phosphate guanylyltransferase/mannose-6-phosphate isomerase n=1 Tax=Microvirga pudoricolor TaxID=2778729 RepID=UPI0019516330|nr:mannose-1-phosphate guanylyltransferase/mannose-6-phosphate isomerase [Microvirga pudoricolor]MBM6593709.1 mannose-1-phosphate guanylyltransferase/mannose-6-phosphate isomerase [Microvirga pudoricolor]
MSLSRHLVPLIICGGAGTRLWPASRKAAPKQFINLMGERSSFQDTVVRVTDPDLFADPVIITNEEYRHIAADQLDALGIKAPILLEPARRDSGPAIAAGAAFIAERNPEAIVIALAADHVVQDVAAFKAAVRTAARAAEDGTIVTFGITPDQPATGYGYIRPGSPLAVPGVSEVAAFVEKPNEETAKRYIADGYLWNSGNFMFRADMLLAEYERFDPQTVEAVTQAVRQGRQDLGWTILDPEAFGAANAVSIDFAVMEKTDKVAVIPVSMGWSDVGSWHAVWELTEKDEHGNAAIGDAVFLKARNNFVSSQSLVCVAGLDNIAVITSGDATLVFDRANMDLMKPLVKELEAQGRPQIEEHMEVFRPWGSYQSLDIGTRFQVKRIVVKPGGRLSLQKHFHRAEHWIVVSGTALVTVGEEQRIVRENESTYIPLGAVHRLENPGRIPLELIEVQSGSYLGEDDIVRLDDVYNRI